MGLVEWDTEAIFYINTPREFVKSLLDSIDPRLQKYSATISSHDSTPTSVRPAGTMQTGTVDLTFFEDPGSIDWTTGALVVASRGLHGRGTWYTFRDGVTWDQTWVDVTISEVASSSEPVVTVRSQGKKGTLERLRFDYGVLSGHAGPSLSRVVAIAVGAPFAIRIPGLPFEWREELPDPGPFSEVAE